jgi:hypothetical protein
MCIKSPSTSVFMLTAVDFEHDFDFIKPRVFSDLILKKVKDFGVNRVKFGKNILRGILGPYRARGVSPGWGWGAFRLGLRLRGPWLRQYRKKFR